MPAQSTASSNFNGKESEEAAGLASPPLPPGWTSVMSKSHKRPFYYHKETNTTVWDRPEATTAEPKSLPLTQATASASTETTTVTTKQDEGVAKPAATNAVPASDSEGEKKKAIPTGPAAGSGPSRPPTAAPTGPANTASAGSGTPTDSVASAYASRRSRNGTAAPPSGPSRLDNDRRRQRTPPPSRNGNGRDDDYADSKRFKSDDNNGRRGDLPPVSGGDNYRSTFLFLSQWETAGTRSRHALRIG